MLSSPKEFIALMRVHLGEAIEQTVSEIQYPAVEYISFLPLGDQRHILIHGEDVALVVDGASIPGKPMIFEKMAEADCEQLFQETPDLIAARRLAKQLEHPEKFQVQQISLSNIWKQ